MTRIVVITDLHANLPAFEALLTDVQREGYDLLVHTGDVIGIGPFPAEVLDLFLRTPNAVPLMGNHDALFAYGLPEPCPDWMSQSEFEHQQWTHAQLDPGLRVAVAQWPDLITETSEEVKISFLHYPLEAPRTQIPIIVDPTIADLDAVFAPYQGPLICYGHHHPFADMQGRARYINPGSLGCAATAIARYARIDLDGSVWSVSHHQVSYDDTRLAAAFAVRQVPERALINRFFFGGRLSGIN